MSEQPKIHIASLDEGFPSIKERPKKLFDDGTYIWRILPLPGIEDKIEPRSAPEKFIQKLMTMSREEALPIWAAFAEERLKEIRDAGIPCNAKVIFTDAQIANLDLPTEHRMYGYTREHKDSILIATRKIPFIDPEELKFKQRPQFGRDCIVLYTKLLRYYRGQIARGKPILYDVPVPSQYAYNPDADEHERFALMDTDIFADDDLEKMNDFLFYAINTLEKMRREASDAELFKQFDALLNEFKSEKELLRLKRGSRLPQP